MPILPLLPHVFSGQRRFLLCHNSVFLCLSPRIQHHFILHLATKYTAFSNKTPCVQQQNATRLAPKHNAFSSKTHIFQLQISPMRARNERLYKKNGYLMHLQIPPFCIKTNLRENRLFVARLTVRDKQELFLHQFLSESFTNIIIFVYARMSNDTYRPYANNRQRLRLLA